MAWMPDFFKTKISEPAYFFKKNPETWRQRD